MPNYVRKCPLFIKGYEQKLCKIHEKVGKIIQKYLNRPCQKCATLLSVEVDFGLSLALAIVYKISVQIEELNPIYFC